MKLNRYHASAIAAALLACAPSTALAQCDLTGYASQVQVLTPPVVVPDGSPSGVLVGSITTPASGTIFTDVLVGLKMVHSYIGDLVVDVTYDAQCNGTPDQTARIVCRPQSEGTCLTGETVTFGCPSDMDCGTSFMFSDAASDEVAFTPASCDLVTGMVVGGCYRPSILAAMPLSVFDGAATGGCFQLRVADYATPDAGSVCEWSVHYTVEGPTADRAFTWGVVKTRYR